MSFQIKWQNLETPHSGHHIRRHFLLKGMPISLQGKNMDNYTLLINYLLPFVIVIWIRLWYMCVDKRKFFLTFKYCLWNIFKISTFLWFQDRLQNFILKTGIKIGSNKVVSFLLIKEYSRTYTRDLFIISTYKF